MKNNLLFRRQFILSSNPKFSFDYWTNLKIDTNLHLSVHPDLEITQAISKTIHLTLLGFVVNPFEPEKSNQEILDDLINDAEGLNDIINGTDPLGGRWIIICKDDRSINIFHDPCGQRQVYYRSNNKLDILCGSDPAIMNYFVKLEKDTSSELKEFINAEIYKKKENAWIGSSSIFKDVEHLMPNHYLNVHEFKTMRFWPNKPLINIDIEKAVELASEILKGSLIAINNRQKLAIAVTAGWDSRVLLAASKEIRDNVTYFVSITGGEKKNFPDIIIPSKLLHKLNLPFYVQKCDREIDSKFKQMIENNILMARTDLSKAKYIYQYHKDFDGMISINGNLSEIARSRNQPIIQKKITGNNLAKLRLIDYGEINYVVKQLDLWINGISSLCEGNRLNIYDMLYWEQRMGNWGSQYPAEQDISIDQFSPFNNRLLLSTLLSVDSKYRIFPKYILYRKIIENLWKETLQQPVGVLGYKKRIKSIIKYIIIRNFPKWLS